MTPRLLAGLPLADAAVGATVMLAPQAAHHAIRVLRRSRGEPIELFDGEGHAVVATIVDAKTGRCEIVARLAPEPPAALAIGLVQGISSAEKMDWTIEKAVELGVDRLVPVQSARGHVRLDEARAARRLEHWQRLAAAACGQCGRSRLPAIDPPLALAAALERLAPAGGPRLVLDPRSDRSLPALLARTDPAPRSIWLACGPESGFGEDETALFARHGWQAVRLGPRVLRTETAAMTAIAIIQGWLGDLR